MVRSFTVRRRAALAMSLGIALSSCDTPAPEVRRCASAASCARGEACVDGHCTLSLDAGRLDAAARDAATLDSSSRDAATLDGAAVRDASTSARAFDLDRDGVGESELHLAPCATDATRACLEVAREDGAFTISLGAGTKLASVGSAIVIGRALRDIGDHTGSRLSEVSVLLQVARGAHDSPALAIVDVDARAVAALTAAPAALARFESYALASFTDFARDPEGRLHPFLAPGYGDAAAAQWGYACFYDAAATSSARCGPGFVEASTVPAEAGWFREVGGYVYDADGDGYDDVHLLYHQRVVTFSPRTGARLASTTFDVAAADEPSAPPWFHSGRNYGTHSAVVGADATIRTLMIGGAPVGSFDDVNCNVSRFVAALDARAGEPSSRRLAWSDYFGFASSIFVRYDPAYAMNPAADLARLGDFTDGCIHRFSDSRTIIDGVESAIFDYFIAEAPFDTCLDEQYALYLPPAWTEEKARIWYACLATNVATMGRWGMQARRVADGASVTGGLDTYVWGRTDALLPSGEIVYVTESLPSRVRFDLAGVAPSALRVYALVGGLYTLRGTFPVVGRPAIVSVAAEGRTGVGAFAGLAELDIADVDGDGLGDVRLADGTRVGWDAASGAFVAR